MKQLTLFEGEDMSVKRVSSRLKGSPSRNNEVRITIPKIKHLL
jgi:hypothetical protein